MDITGTLAKLLATENLTVQHSNAARTASFNVQDRVLTLPVLAGASQEVMTMLAAHEVGHALQTPSDWTERVIDGTPFDFVNVIEDVRIEKFIQAKFPGLKRDFSRGYTELNDNDFFAIADQDVNKMSLIDRLNIHFSSVIALLLSLLLTKSSGFKLLTSATPSIRFASLLRCCLTGLTRRHKIKKKSKTKSNSLTVLVRKTVSLKSKVITPLRTSVLRVERVTIQKKRKSARRTLLVTRTLALLMRKCHKLNSQ